MSKIVATTAFLLATTTLVSSANASAFLGNRPSAAFISDQVTTAAQCIPSSPSDASKLNVFHGAWIFDGANTGTVHLTCALPWPVAYDEDRAQAFPLGRISYRDSTAEDTRSSVKIEVFQRRDSSGSYSKIRDVFSSDNYIYTRDVTVWGTRAGVDAGVNRSLGGALFARVTMTRSSTSDIVAFSHILWIEPPPVLDSPIQDFSISESEEQEYFPGETNQSLETFNTYSSYSDEY